MSRPVGGPRRRDCRANRDWPSVTGWCLPSPDLSRYRRDVAIDLNADLGEETSGEIGDVSRHLLDIVSSANVACGGHAGDVDTMAAVCDLAVQRRIAIGAHISYPDREGFGHRPMVIEESALVHQLVGQIGLLDGIALAAGSAVTYVKAQGALYTKSVDDPRVAELIIAALGQFRSETGRSLAVLCLPRSKLLVAATAVGLAAFSEAFADRAYTPAGGLVPRDQPGAVITDPGVAVARLQQLIRNDEIVAIDGSTIEVRARSICIHSDTRGAVLLARRLRSAIDSERIRIAPFAPPPRPIQSTTD